MSDAPMLGYDNSVGNRQSRRRIQVPETVWIPATQEPQEAGE